MKTSNKSGELTLLDLFIVIFILVILAVLCYPSLRRKDETRTKEIERVMRSHLSPTGKLLPPPGE